MKAMVIDGFGGVEHLRLMELPDLRPAPGNLTIDVAYAGVGFADVMLRRGEFGSSFSMPLVPGLEVSGYVRAIGKGVEGFYIGQPVASMTLLNLGGYATMANVRASLTVPLDTLGSDLDLAAAAASIVNLTTAYMAIKDVNRMQAGSNVLVHAAAGGLGSFLGQVAKRMGAKHVMGTVGSTEKLKLAESLGYDELFIRDEFVERVLHATGGAGVHAVFDPVGGETRSRSLHVLSQLGQLVVVGNAGGEPDVLQSTNSLWLNNQAIAGFSLGGYSEIAPDRVGAAAKEALGILARGEIHSEVSGVYPLKKAAETHLLLEKKNTIGKIVLKIQ
ncbi:quinone oxidoreductase family protein [Paenibacillus rhizophilus]|uniref:Alcohol dehydrogenase n=1 Tax=Paenibacillus rhizophilus TaxID=1850366 RepID=A0A3N9NVY4_9BACL|nr:zinc-binding dehydrogenase [Paenibacillus rhizophilus]RQW07945.1 alcohol dehydrogenase [Paenibacillus rhizophilus]